LIATFNKVLIIVDLSSVCSFNSYTASVFSSFLVSVVYSLLFDSGCCCCCCCCSGEFEFCNSVEFGVVVVVVVGVDIADEVVGGSLKLLLLPL